MLCTLTLNDRAHRAPQLTTDPLAGIRDGILRGIAHALSNRVAALSGVRGLVDFGDLSSQRLSLALQAEVSQLGALVDLLRLLATDSRQRGEAIGLQTVLPQVVALHALHPDLRDVPCTLVHDPETAPVHLTRSALVQSVLVLIDAAKRHALANKGSVTVACAGDPAWVTIAVESNRGPGATARNDDVARLQEHIGPLIEHLDPSLALEIVSTNGDSNGVRLALKLATLKEVRRREQT